LGIIKGNSKGMKRRGFPFKAVKVSKKGKGNSYKFQNFRHNIIFWIISNTRLQVGLSTTAKDAHNMILLLLI